MRAFLFSHLEESKIKMEIQKSQRLSQYLGLVSDMVEYQDIKEQMIQLKVISANEGNQLEEKLKVNGNVAVMNELLIMVSLRRGGFDAFLQALRDSDYTWIAEQLDPGKALTVPSSSNSSNGALHAARSLMTNVRDRISRKSEPMINEIQEETIFTSYRDSCPMDIPINPGFYTSHQQSRKNDDLDTNPPPSNQDKDVLGMLKTLKLKSSDKSNTVLIHNITPEQIEASSESEYFITLAKKANVPSEILKDLKVISKGKISKVNPRKKLRKGGKGKVKLQFTSESARNRFAESMTEFIANIEPTDIMYSSLKQMKVSIPPKKGLKRFNRRKNVSRNSKQSHGTPSTNQVGMDMLNADQSIESKGFWFQKRFKSKS